MSGKTLGQLTWIRQLVETDILIDVARGNGEAIDSLMRLEKGSRLAISAVTQMDLIVGCRNKAELAGLPVIRSDYSPARIV